MKIVNMTAGLSTRFGLKEAIRLIKEHGFDGYDCSLFSLMGEGQIFGGADYLEKAREIREYADSVGIPCLQAHSPDPPLRQFYQIDEMIDSQIKAIEIAAILGADCIVVHPSSITDAEGNYERIYSKLLPTARRLGIKIATENMFAWRDKNEIETVPSACGDGRDFKRYIDYVNDEYFTACLDLGHAEMMYAKGAVESIMALGGKRLGALHVQDNDCLHDDHGFPFTGNIKWEPICKALADVGYSGHFTFEASSYMRNFPNELIPSLLDLLYESGKYLVERIEYYKSAK